MLTIQHLAVIRAALKFLDEEITPNGNEAIASYLNLEDKNLSVAVEHIQQTRQFFDAVDLNYALVDAAGVQIESRRLFPAAQDSSKLRSDLSLIATVLVPINSRQ